MKEDILSVPELPTHTTSSEIFKVLNGFIEERGLEWKNCVGVCTDIVMNLKKKLESYLRVNFVGTGPSSYERSIYRAAVSQRLRNTGIEDT